MTAAEIHPVWCEPNDCDGFHNGADQVVRGSVLIDPEDREACNLIAVGLCQMDPIEDADSSLVPHVQMLVSAEPSPTGEFTRFAISRFRADEARRLADVLVGAAESLDSYLGVVGQGAGR